MDVVIGFLALFAFFITEWELALLLLRSRKALARAGMGFIQDLFHY